MKDDEMLKEENPELFRIAREHGTEPAFTGKYVHTKEDGTYHCAVCDAILFSSETKFDSRSGWPSFTDPIHTKAVTFSKDVSRGEVRTEVRCATCGAHLGHVFPDGPEKDGKVCDRYCINSVSLELKPKDKRSTDSSYAGIDSGVGGTPTDTTTENKPGFWEHIKDNLFDGDGSGWDFGGDGGGGDGGGGD